MDTHTSTEVAIFGGGCFWCVEAVFKMLKGVISVTPGYAGGTTENPTYEEVSSGDTGYAEVVRITFEPALISYYDLLAVFFSSHNPTTLNRQGNDIGTQYRSLILYTSDAQRAEAEQYISELNASGMHSAPIVTEVKPLTAFYEAEAYHQDYFTRHQGTPYCQLVINPKVEKVQHEFARLINPALLS